MFHRTFIPRFYEPDLDLAIVKSWWAEHESPVDLESILPDDGVIIPNVCAAWLYLTSNSNIGWIAWMVGNPRAHARDVHDGLEIVIDELKAFARTMDVEMVTVTTEFSGIVKVLHRVGFESTPNKVTALWART